jgi:fluoride ion exporter CrcB/FEX
MGQDFPWGVLAANQLGGFCQCFVGVRDIQKRTLRRGVGGSIGKSACFFCPFSPTLRVELFKLGEGLMKLEQLPPAVFYKRIHLLLWG